MLIRSLTLLLAATSTSYALKDALPFLLLSTESIDSTTLSSRQLSTADSLASSLRTALGKCDASQYIFVEQPGVRASDLHGSTSMPHLARRMSSEEYRSVVQVPEVIGKMDLVQLQIYLEEKCGREKVAQIVLPLVAEEATGRKRLEKLWEGDTHLDKSLHNFGNHTSHVLIYSSMPVDEETTELENLRYEMDEPPFQENMHTDLKRDVPHLNKRQARGGDNFQDGLPLFERYQFLSPGIFMGLTVSIMLLVILYVGISAIAGLEVSYMAFSKEMGPQAQKKQQ